MNRRSRSITRRSSILKIDVNREDDTGIIGVRNRRSSRRVSFAEMCQIKEFPRDSPKVYKGAHIDDYHDGKDAASSDVGSKNSGITGLDKLLTGAIQTPYQDVAEYPIPEMASESFNIFDINKTVLDTVDMETTQVGGSIDTFLPQMDFQSEPSMELKFDASSFLKSLNGKPHDRLEKTQIYSPNRTSGPTFTTQFNIMEYDKENVIPMEALPPFGNENQEPPASFDSKMFLQRLYGGSKRKVVEDKNEMEEMEETACIGETFRTLNTNVSSLTPRNDDVTKYFDTEDVTVGIEETKCVGGIVVQSNCMDRQAEIDKENSLHFANQTVNMEETRPVGGILKAGNTTNQFGLRMKQGFETSITAEDNATRCFNMEEGVDNGMEETKCVGDILIKVEKSHLDSSAILKSVSQNLSSIKGVDSVKDIRTLSSMEETTDLKVKSDDTTNFSCKGSNLRRDVTVNYNVTGMHDSMEETKTVGGLIDKTQQYTDEIKTVNNSRIDPVNQTVAMEETVPLGKILNTGLTRLDFTQTAVKKSFVPSERLADSTTSMEETKPVGGILKSSSNDMLTLQGDQREDMEITKNGTVPFEMPRLVEGFLDKSRTGKILKSAAEEIGSNASGNFSLAMEETKALGGILDKSITKTAVENSADIYNEDKTIDYTVAMEETRPVGRIFEKPNRAKDCFEREHEMCLNETVNEPVPVEETKTVGGILNKTSDRTIYFEDVKTDWLSKDLKFNDIGKAADGTTDDRQNKSVAIEETNCLGGILTDNVEIMKGKFENIYGHAYDDRNNVTVIEPVQMEETRCITETTMKEVRQINVNEDLRSQTDLSKSKTGRLVCPENEMSVKSKGNETEKYLGKDNSNSGSIIVDDEVTFKCLNKRNFDECRSETHDKSEEKTRELTQTGLAKLKEMLILSKRKAAPSLRQGDIRTPSKLSPLFPGSAPGSMSKGSCSSNLHLGVTLSPVHKKQRLSEGIQADEVFDEFGANEKTDVTAAGVSGLDVNLFAKGLNTRSTMTHADMQGIDDEQMPDTMHIDLCTSRGSSDTHSDKNLSIHSDLVSSTVPECNETHSSGSDVRNNSSVNMSMFSNISNKSFAYSFVVPEGPLSLESFFKLTFTLVSKIQGTRCSAIFAPSIDMDDLVEVLHAELTLTPLVHAKKKMKELFTQQIQKLEANMDWLEKSLEETQPEIFQICAKASSEELQQITDQLRLLWSACYKKSEIAWKQGTKQMFTEAVQDIQVEGIRRAEEMLQKVESDSRSLDDLLTSLDDDLESLDRNEKKLEELQNKHDVLNREMESLSLSQHKRSVEENELLSKLQNLSQKQRTDEMIISLKQDIVAYLLCCEWNLDEFEEDKLVFTFLDDKVELMVNFTAGVEEKQISSIAFRAKSSSACRNFEERVAVELALNGINTTSLRQKFTHISSLPKLVQDVSTSINEIRRFCKELEDVNMQHVLKFKNNSICTELWDRDTLDFIKVTFKFDPSHPLTNHAEASVTVRIGGLRSCDIEEKLRQVSPGPEYLHRLIQAVNFK